MAGRRGRSPDRRASRPGARSLVASRLATRLAPEPDPSMAVRIAVLADDLIWATRLEGQLRTLGAEPVRVRDLDALEHVLAPGSPAVAVTGRVERVVVDLTARAYDGVVAVGRAASAGLPVLAVAQHDDHELRSR